MRAEEKPIIAVTMGEASGIGPEILVETLSGDEVYRHCRPPAVGDGIILR